MACLNHNWDNIDNQHAFSREARFGPANTTVGGKVCNAFWQCHSAGLSATTFKESPIAGFTCRTSVTKANIVILLLHPTDMITTNSTKTRLYGFFSLSEFLSLVSLRWAEVALHCFLDIQAANMVWRGEGTRGEVILSR